MRQRIRILKKPVLLPNANITGMTYKHFPQIAAEKLTSIENFKEQIQCEQIEHEVLTTLSTHIKAGQDGILL